MENEFSSLPRLQLMVFRRSIVIERLRELYKHQTDNSVGIAYIYCDHKETDTQTTVNLLASIWMQLVQRTGTVSDKAKALYKNNLTKEARPSLRDISDLLKDKVQTYRSIFIILDALDECDDDNSREALIGQVRALQPTVRLMVTSRPSDMTKQLLDGATTLEIGASPVDLNSYVESRLARSSRLQQHIRADETLAEEIKRNVVDNAKNMYEPHLVHEPKTSSVFSLGSLLLSFIWIRWNQNRVERPFAKLCKPYPSVSTLLTTTLCQGLQFRMKTITDLLYRFCLGLRLLLDLYGSLNCRKRLRSSQIHIS